MTRIFLLFLTSSTLLLGLSGCGGSSGSSQISSGATSGGSSGDNSGTGDAGSGGGDSGNGDGGGEAPFVSAFNVFEDAARVEYETTIAPDIANVVQTDEIGGFTQLANLPPTGDLTYAGYLNLFVGNGIAGAQINGDASLTVHILERTISGSADNFAGYMLDENNDNRLVDYDGDPVLISFGTLTEGTGGEAVIQFDINGTLNNGVNSFVIDGTMEGNIFGAGGEGLHAYGTSRTSGAGDMASTIDGQPAVYDSATLSALRQEAQP